MQLGMIGLGRMGGNIVRRLTRNGHQCVVFDQSPAAIKALVGEGATGSADLKQLVGQPKKTSRGMGYVARWRNHRNEGSHDAISRLVMFGALLTFCSVFFGWLWLGSLALYAGVLLGAGAVLGRGQPLSVAARIPVVFVAIHFGFAWGFWKEVAKQVRGRVNWRRFRAPQPAGAP